MSILSTTPETRSGAATGAEVLPVLNTNAPPGLPQATAPDAAKDAEISGAPASFLVPALWALLQARKNCPRILNHFFS